MCVHKLCVIILLFFLNTCTPFPASRSPRHARAIDDGRLTNDGVDEDSKMSRTSTVAMNSQEETCEADEDDRLQVQVSL